MSNVFLPIGGGNEIGASSYFVQLNGDKLLLDSGIRLHSEYKHPRFVSLYEKNFLHHLWDLEAILISHGHLDHIGSLPTVVSEAKDVPVYATQPTKAIMELQLKPTRTDETFLDVQAVKEFSEERFQSTIARVQSTPWNQPIQLKNCQVTFFPSGHILGAAMIYIESDMGNVLFTGDFTPFNQMTVPSYQIPEHIAVDLLITESTYGYQEAAHSGDVKAERETFARKIEQCLARNGWVLIPAFAIGRSQEVALILQSLICNKHLKPFPVYIDGLAQIVCDIYEKNGVNIFTKNINKAPKSLIRNLDTSNKGVIIASSGMLLNKSASARYAEKLLSNSRNALFFSGYLDEESPGRKLDLVRRNRGKSFRLNRNTVSVKATVDTYRLSAHTDSKGILDLIKNVRPKKVVFVHGKPQARSKINVYRTTCRRFGNEMNVYQANNGTPIYF